MSDPYETWIAPLEDTERGLTLDEVKALQTYTPVYNCLTKRRERVLEVTPDGYLITCSNNDCIPYADYWHPQWLTTYGS
jgi:hypothetical protein